MIREAQESLAKLPTETPRALLDRWRRDKEALDRAVPPPGKHPADDPVLVETLGMALAVHDKPVAKSIALIVVYDNAESEYNAAVARRESPERIERLRMARDIAFSARFKVGV